MRAVFSPLIRVFFVVIALLPSTRAAHAAAVAGAGIGVDGKPVAGYAITWSGETRGRLVEQLATRPLVFERDYKLKVDPKNPERASLQGRVSIQSFIRGDDEVAAIVKSLLLVKRGGEWFVEAESLRRALSADRGDDDGAEGGAAKGPSGDRAPPRPAGGQGSRP